MKPRARRVTVGAAALGAVLVGVLVVTHWGAVRDHVEAWHFQLTRKTISTEGICPLIFDSEDLPEEWRNFYNHLSSGQSFLPHDDYRFLEQRFPRRAYVVIREERPAQAEPRVAPRPTLTKHPGGRPRLKPESRERIVKRPQ